MDRWRPPRIQRQTGQIEREIKTDHSRLALIGGSQEDLFNELGDRKKSTVQQFRFRSEGLLFCLSCRVWMRIEKQSPNFQLVPVPEIESPEA